MPVPLLIDENGGVVRLDFNANKVIFLSKYHPRNVR